MASRRIWNSEEKAVVTRAVMEGMGSASITAKFQFPGKDKKQLSNLVSSISSNAKLLSAQGVSPDQVCSQGLVSIFRSIFNSLSTEPTVPKKYSLSTSYRE